MDRLNEIKEALEQAIQLIEDCHGEPGLYDMEKIHGWLLDASELANTTDD